ncbi:hypothetical protein ABZ863_01255 [Saccharomonospora sp. NPDC046836]|uniref:hypothetical protein n=1 Tax=Saccharomonospora sp. NPDC046836 TaxID=3156921 RepID=UPI003404958E
MEPLRSPILAAAGPWPLDESCAQGRTGYADANILLDGDGYPMFDTHDPRVIGCCTGSGLPSGRPAAEGETVREYVTCGEQRHGYLRRRSAERLACTAFSPRARVSSS